MCTLPLLRNVDARLLNHCRWYYCQRDCTLIVTKAWAPSNPPVLTFSVGAQTRSACELFLEAGQRAHVFSENGRAFGYSHRGVPRHVVILILDHHRFSSKRFHALNSLWRF